MTKRTKESIKPAVPATINAMPIARMTQPSPKAECNSQRVNNQGTRPASMPGATKKKTVDPIAADCRCMIIPSNADFAPSVSFGQDRTRPLRKREVPT
jgi:hypothetical protein